MIYNEKQQKHEIKQSQKKSFVYNSTCLWRRRLLLHFKRWFYTVSKEWHCFFLQFIYFLFQKLYHTSGVGVTGVLWSYVALFLSPIDMLSLLKALSRYGGDDRGCYIWCRRYVGAEMGVEGGRIARGDPPGPGKSISQIGNPSSGRPTPRFYCRGGGGVCSYWILTGNTEEGAPERPMHSNTNLIKHRSAAPQVARYNFRKQIFQKMWPA